MGDSFMHYEAYSQIASKIKTKESHSIYSIAGESDRIFGYYNHVKEKKDPIILFGVSFSKVVELAEEYAKNTKGVKKRDFIMIAGIISAPADMSDEVWQIYKKVCIKWLIRKWGLSLKSIIEHIDEVFEDNSRHRHLHFAVVPEIGVRFYEIFPALKAKREADKAYGMSKKPAHMTNEQFVKFKKYYKGAGIIAYKKRFKKEQDDFFRDVSDPFGLMRYGPKRLRYSRKQYVDYKIAERIKQENILKREEEYREAQELAKDIAQAQADHQSINNKITQAEKELQDKKSELDILEEREKNVEIKENNQTEYEKALKGDLKTFVLFEPEKKGLLKESANSYRERIMPKIMGFIKLAIDLIKANQKKKKELEDKERELEQERLRKENEMNSRLITKENIHKTAIDRLNKRLKGLTDKIINVKTPSDLAKLQKGACLKNCVNDH